LAANTIQNEDPEDPEVALCLTHIFVDMGDCYMPWMLQVFDLAADPQLLAHLLFYQ
jgi:hypothetical protein